MASFTVTGRIARDDDHSGVFGLSVEIHRAAAPGAAPLFVTLTGRDGSYHAQVSIDEACCGCPELYIVLRDRDCRLIYDGCLDRRCCEPGAPVRIDVLLASAALFWHLGRPLAWELIDEPLVPAFVLQEIEDALELLRLDGVPGSVASLSLADCSSPALARFERVLADAWGTLQGDLEAARRLRDVLETLADSGDCTCSAPLDVAIDTLFAEALQHPATNDCAPPPACAPCASPQDGCAESACTSASFLSEPKRMQLLFGALQLACGDRPTAARYVQALLAQFRRFSTLDALHAASHRALLGDKAARAHVRDLLEQLKRCCQGCDSSQPCVSCIDPSIARCLRTAIASFGQLSCWRVCEVRPPRACSGEEILVVGSGFGDRPGLVRFRGRRGVGFDVIGAVKSWCNDRISVIVPQGAGCGLALELPSRTLALCGRFLELRPLGCIERGFEGGAAMIQRFDIRGHHAGECPLPPGEPLRVRWTTCAADRVRVEVIDLANGVVLGVLDPAPAVGRWDFADTHFSRTTRVRVRISVWGRCQPAESEQAIDLVFQRRPSLQVHGLEVTQSIQHYRAAQHLSDAADRGPDNSLRLVADKTAWVRAYLRSGQDPAFDDGRLADVTGTLGIERRVAGIWNTVGTIAPQNGPVVAEDSFATYRAERGDIGATLNFVVPAKYMTGLLRFTVDVHGPFPSCPGHHARATTHVDVNLRQTLNAAFITVGYVGPNAPRTGNIALPAPTQATCQAETRWALTTFPVSSAPNVRMAGTFVTNTPIDDARSCPGCCSPNWAPLLTKVAALVALDQAANLGQDWAYYGIIASGIPVNVPGCSGGATGGVEGQAITYAHEIGHQFGLPHARCGNAGTGNAAYPIYEPYDLPVDPPGTTDWTMASIGEFGLDINSGAIADPASFEDFMSYCGPRWISKFTHDYLINRSGLAPEAIATGAAGALRVVQDGGARFDRDESILEPLVLMLGLIRADGSVDVANVARLETRYLRGRGQASDYRAQLLDEQGVVLAEDVVYTYQEDGGCGCGERSPDAPQARPFKIMLRNVACGAELRIVKQREVVWQRKRAKATPKLSCVFAAFAKCSDSLELSWELDRALCESPEVWVRWSDDDGKTWHALSVGLQDGHASIPASALPSGSVRFELLAHDGFDTQSAITEPVCLPERSPSLTILYPTASEPVYRDRQIHLWGSACTFAGRIVEPASACWYIDGAPVGEGLDIWVDNPGAGTHELELVVRDRHREARVCTRFTVR